MIPDLPPPHRFLANLIIMGSTGFRAWDDNDIPVGSPRRTSQLGWGSAATTGDSLHVFDADDLHHESDGSVLQFGDNYRIAITYPEISLQAQLQGLDVDLRLTSTDVNTWVSDSGIYRHFTLLCAYEGQIALTDSGERQQVKGMCTFEYGTGYLPYMDLPRPLPKALKIPADFFSYHVIAIDHETQLVACVMGAFGDLTAGMAGDIRTAEDGSRRLGISSTFEVTTFDSKPISYHGRSRMVMPSTFRWTFVESDGSTSYIDGEVDTQWLYAGMGYIAGYRWSGVIDGLPRDGRAYTEYSDRRS
ncbi:MAG: DUF6670 family protein [Gordonia sp. (in: high G+C Gram-positive bacteria)]